MEMESQSHSFMKLIKLIYYKQLFVSIKAHCCVINAKKDVFPFWIAKQINFKKCEATPFSSVSKSIQIN